MKKHKLAFIDIETTGTNPDKHEIIEIGCIIATQEGREIKKVEEFDIKIKPTRIADADQAALRINKYNDEDWLFAVSIKQALTTLAEKTEGAIVAGQNISFDLCFLEPEYRRQGIKWGIQYYPIDTKSIAFQRFCDNDEIKNYSLRELCAYYGIQNENAHSALSDIRATFEVYKKLLTK